MYSNHAWILTVVIYRNKWFEQPGWLFYVKFANIVAEHNVGIDWISPYVI